MLFNDDKNSILLKMISLNNLVDSKSEVYGQLGQKKALWLFAILTGSDRLLILSLERSKRMLAVITFVV